jgi:addiction module HigA family antidote
VIKSFRDGATQALFDGRPPGRFRNIAKVATRKLDMLDAAARLQDLRRPPGNRLEALKGDRAGQYSIRSTISGGSASYGRTAPKMSRSSTTTASGRGGDRVRTHPGEVLREEFMAPLGLSANALALALRVPATRIGAIIREDRPRAVTADTALRLSRYFGTTPEFWLNLQTAYDLSMIVAEVGARIERDVQPRAV